MQIILSHFLRRKKMQYLDNTWGLDDPQNAAKYGSALWYHRQELDIPSHTVNKYESILRKWQRSANKEIAQARQDGRSQRVKGSQSYPIIYLKDWHIC